MKYNYLSNDESSLFEVVVLENGESYERSFTEQICDFDDETLEIGYYNIPQSKEHVVKIGSVVKIVENTEGKVFSFDPKVSYSIHLFKFDRMGTITESILYENLSIESYSYDEGVEIPLKRNYVKFKKAQ